MSLIGLFLLAVGLSMDAFAVAVFKGLAISKVTVKKSLVVGLYFGTFQAGMPLIGYSVATLFADYIIVYGHWVAFVLLSFIGGKMIFNSFRKEGCSDRVCPAETCTDRTCPGGKRPGDKAASLRPAHMLSLAFATSIDALAVGVSFAFLEVGIIPAVLFIGVTTLVISMIGVKIGSVFGERFKSKAELLGGIILVMIGFKILLEHLGMI